MAKVGSEDVCFTVCWNEKPKTAVFVDVTSTIVQSVEPNLQNIEPCTSNSQIELKKPKN